MDRLEQIFALSSDIRYVALYEAGALSSRQAGDLVDASASESDSYEELLVNPVLLTLVRQRRNVDCGGARFLVVRYGNFYQLIIDLPGGHASVCFQLSANPLDFAAAIHDICCAAGGQLPGG